MLTNIKKSLFGYTKSAKINFVIAAILTVILLGMAINLDLPYEQDQGSKAAKISYLVKTDHIFDPLAGPEFYRDQMFSFYYILSALIFKIFGGEIFLVMNVLSLVMGIFFFTSLYCLLYRTFHVNPLLSCVVFLSMPILVTSFIYGNEVAFAITFFTISILVLSYRIRGYEIVSSLLLGLSILSRPDVILLLPFWFGWLVYFAEPQKKLKELIRLVIKISLYLIGWILLYWLVFIREFLQLDSLSFGFSTNFKLLAAYLIYPFNPTIVLLGFFSLVSLLRKEKWFGILIILSGIPFLFYYSKLSSPKYIISFVFLFGIPLVLFLNQTKIWRKVFSISAIGFWYIFSITPYGILGPKSGGFLFVPTADGAIPSGAYFSFYKNIKNGFFSHKYKKEIEGLRLAVYAMTQDETAMLVGIQNGHFYKLALAAINQDYYLESWMERRYLNQFPEEGLRALMTQRGYLSVNKMSDGMRGDFLEYLKNGQVQNMSSGEDQPFPLLLEIGRTIPKGNDIDLANRILFAIDYYGGNAIFNSSIAPNFFRPTFWAHTPTWFHETAGLYSDSQWTCYAENEQDALMWISELPVQYIAERDPNR